MSTSPGLRERNYQRRGETLQQLGVRSIFPMSRTAQGLGAGASEGVQRRYSRRARRPRKASYRRRGESVQSIASWIAMLREGLRAAGNTPLQADEQQALGALIMALAELLGETESQREAQVVMAGLFTNAEGV